jgi:hypothetical protein
VLYGARSRYVCRPLPILSKLGPPGDDRLVAEVQKVGISAGTVLSRGRYLALSVAELHVVCITPVVGCGAVDCVLVIVGVFEDTGGSPGPD